MPAATHMSIIVAQAGYGWQTDGSVGYAAVGREVPHGPQYFTAHQASIQKYVYADIFVDKCAVTISDK